MPTKNQKMIISLLILNLAVVAVLLLLPPVGRIRPDLLSNAPIQTADSRFSHLTPVGDTDSTDTERLSRPISDCTAYCPCKRCCGRFSDGITASGHKIRPGDRFVAAPCEIPFGTMLRVPGYNNGRQVPVLDRGRLITGNHIDVFFNSHEEALRWGVQRLEVEICLQNYRKENGIIRTILTCSTTSTYLP